MPITPVVTYFLSLFCRAFSVSGRVRPEEAVQATLSSLPDEVVDTVQVTTLPSEDSLAERRRKLEFLEMQEELIKVGNSTILFSRFLSFECLKKILVYACSNTLILFRFCYAISILVIVSGIVNHSLVAWSFSGCSLYGQDIDCLVKLGGQLNCVKSCLKEHIFSLKFYFLS